MKKYLLILLALFISACNNQANQTTDNLSFIVFNSQESQDRAYRLIDNATLYRNGEKSVYPEIEGVVLRRHFNNPYNNTIIVLDYQSNIVIYDIAGNATAKRLFDNSSTVTIDDIFFDEDYTYVIGTSLDDENIYKLIRRYTHDFNEVDETSVDFTGLHYRIIDGNIYFIRETTNQDLSVTYTLNRKFFNNNNLDVLAEFNNPNIIDDYIVNDDVILFLIEDIESGQVTLYRYLENSTLEEIQKIADSAVIILNWTKVNGVNYIVYGEVFTTDLQQGIYQNINLHTGVIRVQGDNVVVRPNVCENLIPSLIFDTLYCPSFDGVDLINLNDFSTTQHYDYQNLIDIDRDNLHQYNIVFFSSALG